MTGGRLTGLLGALALLLPVPAAAQVEQVLGATCPAASNRPAEAAAAIRDTQDAGADSRIAGPFAAYFLSCPRLPP